MRSKHPNHVEKRVKLDRFKAEGRLKKPNQDIGSVWAEQQLLRKRQNARDSKSIAILATLNALSTRIKNNNSFKKIKRISIDRKIVSSQSAQSQKTRVRESVKKKNTSIRIAMIALPIGVLLLFVFSFIRSDKPDQAGDVLGVNGDQPTIAEEKPTFDLLYPSSKKQEDFKIVRVSPSGNDPAYTYIDTVDNADINISQQQLPEKFRSNPEAELERIAKEFQATSVIQIDESKVYHGYSESANVQSLVFIKNNILVLIRSPKKISDDVWAGYLISYK